MSVFMQPIYTATVGAGGVASITFNNIPQGFTDLKLVLSVKTNWASNNWDDLNVRFNDSTSGYSSNSTFLVNSVTTISGQSVGGTSAQVGWCANTNFANVFGNTTTTIPNYTSANSKTWSNDTTIEGPTATTVMGFISNTWDNPAPITKMTFTSLNAATILEYSTITLYGVSNTYDTARPTAPVIGTVTDQAGFASVAFTPASNDQADTYVVTSTPSGSTTYGARSPIATPATVGTSYTYQVASVNALGTGASSASSALTTSNSYSSIATFTSSGSTGVFEFTNIPQNYTHLQVRIFARSNRSAANDSIYFRANGDSNTNYSWHTMYGDGGGVYAGSSINDNNMQPLYIPAANATTGFFGCAIVDILDYTNPSKFKTFRSVNGYDVNGSGITCLQSSNWRSQAPITYLLFANYFTSATFAAGTTFALYGIA